MPSKEHLKKPAIKESRGRSLYINGLPRGCQLCIQGAKAVIFAGGSCTRPAHCCWYCPISEERRDPLVRYVDETRVNGIDDILHEIDAIDAKGISFTGGEPLGASFGFVREVLVALEDAGLDLHVHLYTTGVGVDPSRLESLAALGVDEIRFHPPGIDVSRGIMERAIELFPSVGCEVPAVPDMEHEKYIKNIIEVTEKIGGKFVNLNEFEFSETNATGLSARGYRLRPGTIASVEGSEELAMKILEWYQDEIGGGLMLHYCPIVTKDEVQLGNRYRRRARNTRRPVEMISDDGTVIFGSIRFGDHAAFISAVETLDYFRLPAARRRLVQVLEASREIHFHPSLLDDDDFHEFVLEMDGGLVEALPLDDREECEYTPLSMLDGEFLDDGDEQ